MPSVWLPALVLVLMDVGMVRAEGGTAEGGAPSDPGAHKIELTDADRRVMHGKVDENGDGQASVRELVSFAQKVVNFQQAETAQALFAELDASHDGSLSLEEYLDDVHAEHADYQSEDELRITKEVERKKFEAADVNVDTFLDVGEFQHLRFPGSVAAVLHVHTQETMRLLDSDGDSQISLKEFLFPGITVTEQDFQGIDSNKNGFLDLEELKAWDSGAFRVKDSVRGVLEVADANGDSEISLEEFEDSWAAILSTGAEEFMLSKWATKIEL